MRNTSEVNIKFEEKWARGEISHVWEHSFKMGEFSPCTP
jgi:hypothetical protein